MAKKTTSPKVAKTASKVLRDGGSATAKKVAGSALSQREKKK